MIASEDGAEVQIQVAADTDRDMLVIRLSRPVEVFTIEYGTSVGLGVLFARKIQELADYKKQQVVLAQAEIRAKMIGFWKELIRFSWWYVTGKLNWRQRARTRHGVGKVLS